MALDDKDGGLNRLVQMGKEKGYVLYDEVSEVLPGDFSGGEELDDVLAGLDTAGIEILEEPKDFEKKLEESEEFLDLGRAQPGRSEEFFNMAVLAIRTASVVNGVSRLHARISRVMWRSLWPGIPTDEIPIAHVTNGVHPQSWISNEMRHIYDSYLGPGWAELAGDTSVWRRSAQIPTDELWRTHERRRERLVTFSRRQSWPSRSVARSVRMSGG